MAESPRAAVAKPATPPNQGSVGKLSYFILPKENDLPSIQTPDDTKKTKLLGMWKELVQLERHEDSLFNSRLQGFLVATSFLIAAFSQFKDTSPSHQNFRLSLCAFGIFLSLVMAHVLRRTARAIEWYLAALIRLDQALFDEDCQPYRLRRVRQGTINASNKIVKPPVLFWLGVCVPWVVVSLWVALLLFSFELKPPAQKASEVAAPASTPAVIAAPAATPAASASPAITPAPPAATPLKTPGKHGKKAPHS